MSEISNFKQSMANFATGVAIITTIFEGDNVGITVNSFTSVSLDPTLVLYCLEKKSIRYVKFINQLHFTINILSESQKSLSTLFSRNQIIDWEQVGYVKSKVNGCPVLNGVTASLDCELYMVHDGADHSIIIAKVLAAEAYDLRPLIYHDRQYKKIGEIM